MPRSAANPPLLKSLFWLVAALASTGAHAQIYRCEGQDGVVEYSNNSGNGQRNCRVVDTPITTIPAPKLPPAAAARPSAPSGTPTAAAPGSSAGTAGTAARSPDGFPKVDSATQKFRDNDRKRLLEDELRKEEGKLAELKKEFNGGEPERRGEERNYQRYLDRVQRLKDDISRTETNIDSLRRELRTL